MRHVCLFVLMVFVAVTAFASPGDSFVLRDGDITYMQGKGMPAEELKAIQKTYGNHFFWARRRDGKVYVARDQRTLREARDVLQRNVKSGPETARRLGVVMDGAVKRGAARTVRQ